MSVLGDIFESILREQVTKTVDGFTAKYALTPEQNSELINGIMVAIQLGGEVYADSQQKG